MDDEDQVSLKALYEDNDNMIDMLEESIDHCKVTGEKEVVSDYGVKELSTYTTIGWIRILDGWMVKVGFTVFLRQRITGGLLYI